MLTSIAGRSVVVTGASKGIGKGIARVFCQNGCNVLVVSRHADEAEACAEELRRAGGAARSCAADVRKFSDMQMMAAAAAAAYGGIDILCANAGMFPQARIEDLSPEDWDQVMATNLKGTFLAIKACLPHLKKSDQGRIVITSSITGPVTGFPGWSHYGATKAGQLDSCAQRASSARSMASQ
jgi:3-oxoacyl-[acyl-carrier protein] reductase